MENTPKLTAQQLREAASLTDQIESLQGRLSNILSGQVIEAPQPQRVTPAPKARRKRNLTEAGRKGISEGQQKRWAAYHAKKNTSSTPKTEPPAANPTPVPAGAPAPSSAPVVQGSTPVAVAA